MGNVKKYDAPNARTAKPRKRNGIGAKAIGSQRVGQPFGKGAFGRKGGKGPLAGGGEKSGNVGSSS